MLTTAIIAFREFLEAFLLVGIFLGMDKKFQLRKKKEILFASMLGIMISLLLPVLVFIFAGQMQYVLTEKNTDILEGYFLTFSGFFLAYIVFSLHEFMKDGKKQTIATASQKMEAEIFDISLFFTIVFFIIREGFEIALLIATTSLFSVFSQNIEGLLLGFFLASSIGIITTVTYVQLPIKKIFQYTEYLILIIGAAMIKNGVSILFENYFHIHLEKLFSLSLQFLPSETTVIGHAINNLFGLQRNLSMVQIGLMGVYILLVYCLFKVHKP